MARGYTIHTRPNGDVEVTKHKSALVTILVAPVTWGLMVNIIGAIATNVIFGVFIALAIVVWIAKKVEEIKRQ